MFDKILVTVDVVAEQQDRRGDLRDGEAIRAIRGARAVMADLEGAPAALRREGRNEIVR